MSKIKEDHVGLVIDAKTEKAQQELRQLERATADLRKEMKARQNAMLELEAAGKKESDEYKRLQAEVKNYNAQIKNNETRLRSLRSALDVNAMTMSQLKKQAKELQTALNNTSKATNPKEYEHLATQLRNVNGRIAELKRDASGLAENMGKHSSGIRGKFEGMFSSISGGWTKLVGVATAAVASITAVIEGAKWWYNYNTGIEEAQRLTREFTGLTGDELVQTRSKIQAIAGTFGKEYKDVLSAVDGLMAQYGISAAEAMKVVEDGFTAGADLGGNMLAMINQYSGSFRDAGIEASQLVSIIAQTRSGIFSEGGMALIQMASKKIREMSGTTAAALDAIGISSKKVEADLKSGSKNTFDIIQQISGKLKTIPQDSQEVGNVLKDVFGRQGAAGGLKMIESLANMTTKIEDVKKVTGEYGELQEQEVEAQTRLNEKMSKFFGIGDQGFEEITMKAKIFTMNALSKIIDYTVKIINYFVDLYNESIIVRTAVEQLKMNFKNTWEVVKFGVNLVIDGFKAMGKMAKGFATILDGMLSFNVEKVSAGAQALITSYKDAFTEIAKDAKSFGKNVGKNFTDAVNNSLNNKSVAHVSVDMSPTTSKTTVAPATTTHTDIPGNGTKGGKKKTKTSDPDTTAAKAFNHDRTTDLDAAKLAYNQDLNVLRQALAEKRLTQEQYNASQSALNIQHQNNLLTIEQTYLQRSQTLQIKDAEKRKQLQEQQAKAVTDQQQTVNNAYLDAEKLFYDTLSRMKSTAPAAPQTLQQECDAKLLVLDGYYQASLKLAKEDAQRQQQVTADYEAAKAAIIADYAKKAEDEKTHAKQEFGLDTFKDQYEAQAKKRKEAFDKGVIDKQQYDQAMANLDQQAEEHRLQIRQQYGLATQQELYNAELEQLKMHLQNKEISETEYEEAVKNLKIAKAKEAFDYYANLTSGAMQALMQAEEANVDAKYDAEIEAAKNAGKDTTELEKKKANEKLKIQKKYADVNFAIQAAQIIASTAAAIAKTFSELGFPAGIPAAALMSVTGTAQLAAALAERNKVKKMTMQGAASSASSGARVATGLESGGSIDIEREQDGKRFHAAYEPNRRGFIDKPTVIVGEGGYGHSKEWVASNAAVENPTIAPVIDIIDRAQRAGTIRTLDMNKFLLQQASGRAAGGTLTSHTPSALSNTAPADPQKDELIRRLTTVLDRLASEGISASVAIDEIEQKQQLRDKARRFGSKAE